MPKDMEANWFPHMEPKIQLLEKTVYNENSFSLTHLLENYEKQPFVDDFHYTSAVCDLIASSIAQKIKIP